MTFDPAWYFWGLPDETSSTYVSYLSLSMLPALRSENKYFGWYVCAGPRIELKIHSHDGDYTGLSSQTNTANLGFSAGFGIDRKIGEKFFLTAEFRYSRDLTSSAADANTLDDTTYPFNFTNNSLDFLLGINFCLSKEKGN